MRPRSPQGWYSLTARTRRRRRLSFSLTCGRRADTWPLSQGLCLPAASSRRFTLLSLCNVRITLNAKENRAPDVEPDQVAALASVFTSVGTTAWVSVPECLVCEFRPPAFFSLWLSLSLSSSFSLRRVLLLPRASPVSVGSSQRRRRRWCVGVRPARSIDRRCAPA